MTSSLQNTVGVGLLVCFLCTLIHPLVGPGKIRRQLFLRLLQESTPSSFLAKSVAAGYRLCLLGATHPVPPQHFSEVLASVVG